MGTWVSGAIVSAGDVAKNWQGSRLVRRRGQCRDLDRW
jgi:hypothetical protein